MADRKYTGKDYVSDIIRGMASGLGAETVPMYQAMKADMPEAAGTSPEIFRAMMGSKKANQMDLLQERYNLMGEMQRERLAQQAKLQEEAWESRKKLEEEKGGDPRARFIERATIAAMSNPGFNYGGLAPEKWTERLGLFFDSMNKAMTSGGKADKSVAQKTTYKTKEELQSAYDQKKISAAEAIKIAQEKGW